MAPTYNTPKVVGMENHASLNQGEIPVKIVRIGNPSRQIPVDSEEGKAFLKKFKDYDNRVKSGEIKPYS